MQWSFRRSKRSYKLSFTQFVANSVLQLPCQAHTGACRGVVGTVRPGQLPDSCVLNSDGHRLGKCTKLFPSCYAKRRHFWQFHRSEGSYDRLSCGVAPAGSLGRFASCPGILHQRKPGYHPLSAPKCTQFFRTCRWILVHRYEARISRPAWPGQVQWSAVRFISITSKAPTKVRKLQPSKSPASTANPKQHRCTADQMPTLRHGQGMQAKWFSNFMDVLPVLIQKIRSAHQELYKYQVYERFQSLPSLSPTPPKPSRWYKYIT